MITLVLAFENLLHLFAIAENHNRWALVALVFVVVICAQVNKLGPSVDFCEALKEAVRIQDFAF